MSGTIVDLFAGPGGWSEGLRMLGLSDIGIEWDRDACLTRRAAGHLTIRADVAAYPPEVFAGAWGLIASPPCPDWSVAGSGLGREGASGWLVDLVPAWVEAVRPEWICCEQVPGALPVWREHAELYRTMGYSVWCGVLNAADFGVPQVRKRALLIASVTGPAVPPEPTHAKFETTGLFDDRAQWIPMADALGWGSRPVATLRHSFAESSPDSWTDHKVALSRPSPTVDTKARAWCWERPATTICADSRLGFPGHHDENARQFSEAHGSVRLTLAEALTLQSFRPDYPMQGSRSSGFTQIGNAVPPLLAAHVVSAASGVPMPSLAVAS